MKKIILGLSILLLFACKNEESIIKVGLASAGCHSECPHIAIELNQDLKLKYYGGLFAKKQGFYTGNISQGYWSNLSHMLLKSNLSTLHNENYNDYGDRIIEIYIKTSSKTHRINGQMSGFPAKFQQVVKVILEAETKFNLTRVTDSLHFETKSQYIPADVPKFPPGS